MIYFKCIILVFCILFAQNTYAQQYHFGGGYEYSVFICSNQTLYSWGDNNVGQLARTQGLCNNKLPCIAPIPYSIKTIDPGFGQHCLAITTLKNVISWGTNYYGELGINETCPSYCYSSNANKVLGGETGTPYLENAISIATGQSHSYALLNTGEVVAWGNNSFGQLGDGTTSSKNIPVYVKKSNGVRLQNIIKISAGANHGYALTAEGKVYAWGYNQSNQLGCGNSNNQIFPQLVLDKNLNVVSGITSIDGGKDFGLLLRNSSMVLGLGAYKGTSTNESGIIYQTYPYANLVTGGQTPNYYLENVVAISAGYSHSIAIIKENNINYAVAWGDNRFESIDDANGGQFGAGNISTKQFFSPQYMLRSSSIKINGVTAISAGCGVSYLQVYNNTNKQNQFWICGANTTGQLGTNDFIDRIYLTQITSNVCTPYCTNISYEDEVEYCSPFDEVIRTNIYDTDYSFEWYKNGIIISNTADSLIINSAGMYNVQISDILGECPMQFIQLYVKEKPRNFQPIYASYCGNDVTYKVVGNGTFTWSKDKFGTTIATGNVITIPCSSAFEIITDSIYQMWVTQENVCQPVPITSIKNCNCSVAPPLVYDTTSCYNRPYFVRAQGDSIIWYINNTGLIPLFLNNVYYPTFLGTGTYTYYASQIINRCESPVTPVNLELIYCEPWFTITGTVFKNKPLYADSVKVFLYNSVTHEYIDSSYTNSNGEFTLFTHGNSGKILALSKTPQHLNTWAGNDTSMVNAHEFIFDASIKGIEIDLIEKNTSLEQITNLFNTNAYSKVELYSLDGKLLYTSNIIDVNSFRVSQGIYIIKLSGNNNSTKSYFWKKK